MKLVVRGDTEYGDSSTQAIEVKPKYFNPKYLEVYMGDEGEELLVKTYRVAEPLTDTPEQHIQECECDRSFSGDKLPAFYCCCKDPIFNLKREQPTQEIEPLGKADFANTPDEKPWYRDLFVINSKINELVAAVNALQKEKNV